MKIGNSIKAKLTLWYCLIIAVLVTFFSLTAYALLSQGLNSITVYPWNLYSAQTENMPDGSVSVYKFSAVDPHIANLQSSSIKTTKTNKPDLVNSASADGTIRVGDVVLSRAILSELDVADNEDIWFNVYRTGDSTGLYVTTQSKENVLAIQQAFNSVLFISIPLTLAMAGLLGYLLVWRMLRPLQVITDAAQSIEGKTVGRRLDIEGEDEFGKLAAALNHMLSRLEGAFKNEKQITSDVSHELRTPLAIIETETSLILNKERNSEEYKRSLESISRETERMSSLVKRLLLLARYENESMIDFVTMDLSAFLSDLAADIKILCEEKSVIFSLSTPDSIFVIGEKLKLTELFFNLFNNAIKYTPPGGQISVSLISDGDKARIDIEDSGVGISAEHIGHIFERFYRADRSRDENNGGYGLGLTICQSIVELHGGTIKVKSKLGKGSTFSVILPRINGMIQISGPGKLPEQRQHFN